MPRILPHALAGILFATASQAAVLNGSFEQIPGPLTQDNGHWEYFAAIPGWSTSSGSMIEVQSTGTLPHLVAHDGQNYAEVDSEGNSPLYQDVALAAGNYLLRFFYSPRTNDSGGTNDMAYSVQGLLSGSITGAPSVAFPRGVWTEVTEAFTVSTPGTYRLSFVALGASDLRGALIDSVSITPAPVPLPAAGLMLLTALGAGAAMRRRKS